VARSEEAQRSPAKNGNLVGAAIQAASVGNTVAEVLFEAESRPRVLPSPSDVSVDRRLPRSMERPGRNNSRYVPPQELTLHVTLNGGRTISCPVIDLSNRGVALRLEAQEDIQCFLPGKRIARLAIWNQDREVLGEVGAVVRHVKSWPEERQDAASGYKVGLEFLQEPRAGIESAGDLVEHPSRKAALLREGLRCGALTVTHADLPAVPLVFGGGRVGSDGSSVKLTGEDLGDLRPGDPVRVTFDLSGLSCSFVSAVTALERPITDGAAPRQELHLHMPRALRVHGHRLTNRFRPPSERPIEVLLRSPFSGEAIRVAVLDINASGLSFSIDDAYQPYPVGTRLDSLQLLFPDGREIFVQGTVRSLVPLSRSIDGVPQLKCGVEFADLSEGAMVALADEIVRSNTPSVEGTQGVAFDEVWQFLQDSGFIYPEKLEKLAAEMPRIRQTMTALLGATNSRIFKTVLFRKEGVIQGHLAAVRAYRNTWLIQHLAALRGGKALFAASVLNQGLADYVEQLPEVVWIKMFYRPNNRWPARVFGTFARRLRDPALSDLRRYDYWSGPTRGLSSISAGLRVRPAHRDELGEVQRLSIASGRIVGLQADDLSLDRVTLSELTGLFREVGLERRREVLVAERDSEILGVALLEISSLGLNLSELTNTFSVQLAQEDSNVRKALIAAARNRYAELGRMSCVALSEGPVHQDFEQMGFHKTKEYYSWTWHRSLIRSYHEYVGRLFGRWHT
jgi:hypothetical protein